LFSLLQDLVGQMEEWLRALVCALVSQRYVRQERFAGLLAQRGPVRPFRGRHARQSRNGGREGHRRIEGRGRYGGVDAQSDRGEERRGCREGGVHAEGIATNHAATTALHAARRDGRCMLRRYPSSFTFAAATPTAAVARIAAARNATATNSAE
jgi:hypothetical protein